MTLPQRPEIVMDLSGSGRSKYVLGIRIAVEISLIVVMALGAHTSMGFPELARVFPLTVTLAALAFAVASLALDIRLIAKRVRTRRAAVHTVADDRQIAADDAADADADAEFRRAAYYIVWLIALLLAMRLLGALAGAIVYLAVFLKLEAKWRWLPILIGLAVTFALVYELHDLIDLKLPSGYFDVID